MVIFIISLQKNHFYYWPQKELFGGAFLAQDVGKTFWMPNFPYKPHFLHFNAIFDREFWSHNDQRPLNAIHDGYVYITMDGPGDQGATMKPALNSNYQLIRYDATYGAYPALHLGSPCSPYLSSMGSWGFTANISWSDERGWEEGQHCKQEEQISGLPCT